MRAFKPIVLATVIAISAAALAAPAEAARATGKGAKAKAAKKKKAKAVPGPAGPQGPAGSPGATGAQGAQGPAGASGSPDTPAQVLAKLLTVDGSGSALDADLLDGLSSAAFLGATAAAGGDLSGNYPSPTIAGGAVTIAKLAFDPATQAELDALASSLSSAGTINLAGNPVDWTKLKGVPADFADGTDATGGTPSGSAGGDLAGTYPNPTVASGAITDAEVAAANKDGAAGTPSLRTLGTGAQQAAAGNDARLSDSRTPTGPAGGALSGTYPDPTLNVTGGTASATTCSNGQEISAISTGAAITCTAGVYSDADSNVAAGPTSFPALAGGVFNSAVGEGALASNTTGFSNSAVGRNALLSNTTGGANSAVGQSALGANTTASGNSALGRDALGANTTGDQNSAVGFTALQLNTTGVNNSAVGTAALRANTTGGYNSAVGQAALFSNTTGTLNSALGQVALSANTTGSNNSAVGRVALGANTTGSNNSAVGQGALDANTTAGNNSALGQDALGANTTGATNTALGRAALVNNTTGSNNIAVGDSSGGNLTTGANNIAIGNGGVAAESNTIRIGTGLQTRAFIAGISGVTTGGAAVPVLVDSNGQLGTISSSRRYKTEIEPLTDLGDELMALEPVSFRYREGSDELHYGLIAEQVEKVLPTLVTYNEQGLPETVQYQELPALLLAELQDEKRRNDRQQAQIERQQAQIDELLKRTGGE